MLLANRLFWCLAAIAAAGMFLAIAAPFINTWIAINYPDFNRETYDLQNKIAQGVIQTMVIAETLAVLVFAAAAFKSRTDGFREQPWGVPFTTVILVAFAMMLFYLARLYLPLPNV
jgi:hypothetical protein